MRGERPGAIYPDDPIAALEGKALGEGFDCPYPHGLGGRCLHLRTPKRQAALVAHLLEYQRCADEEKQIHKLLAAVEVPIPAGSIARIHCLAAGLVTPASGTGLALRGGDSNRLVTYRSGELQLTLHRGSVVRRGKTSLTGLIWHERDDTALVEVGRATLIATDGTTQATTIDDLGNFSFDSLAVGIYQLEVRLGDDLIAINDLQIGR